MAARKDPTNLPQSYDLQRAKQLLNRLTAFANGKAKMSAAQVNAARVVINKEIPDVAKLEHVGAGGGPISVLVQKNLADRPA